MAAHVDCDISVAVALHGDGCWPIEGPPEVGIEVAVDAYANFDLNNQIKLLPKFIIER